MALWERIEGALLRGLTTPSPPLRAGAELLLRLGPHGVARLARLGLLPARRFAEEHFAGAGAARLLAGNTLHADLAPESALGGFFGFFLCALGQRYGFPVPEGGAGRLTDALVGRAASRGAVLRCDAHVDEVVVRAGKAVGVRIAGGEELQARRGIFADVDGPTLLLSLVGRGQLSPAVVRDVERFERDWATVKVDWTLDGPIPWAAADARRSPVVHLADSVDELSVYANEIQRGLVPARPFLVLGQYASADPTRAPAGKETAWAYTHVPLGIDVDPADAAERIEAQVERYAPGFRSVVRGRYVATPRDLEAADASLVGGALGGGTAQLHQQLVFRPHSGLGRPQTPIHGLYLASSSAHPGPGVHGAAGWNAARSALHSVRARRLRGPGGGGRSGCRP
jgi:phytoene dehydrogenase-like protein